MINVGSGQVQPFRVEIAKSKLTPYPKLISPKISMVLMVVFFDFLKSFLVPLECSFFVCGFCPTLVRYENVVFFIYGKIFKVLNKFGSNEAMLWCFAP